jgi:hypothetical protein
MLSKPNLTLCLLNYLKHARLSEIGWKSQTMTRACTDPERRNLLRAFAPLCRQIQINSTQRLIEHFRGDKLANLAV